MDDRPLFRFCQMSKGRTRSHPGGDASSRGFICGEAIAVAKSGDCMVQKAGSEKYKTSFPDPDATEFTHDLEEYSAPDFPERLSIPMQVDLGLLARIDAAKSVEGPVGQPLGLVAMVCLTGRGIACPVDGAIRLLQDHRALARGCLDATCDRPGARLCSGPAG